MKSAEFLLLVNKGVRDEPIQIITQNMYLAYPWDDNFKAFTTIQPIYHVHVLSIKSDSTNCNVNIGPDAHNFALPFIVY